MIISSSSSSSPGGATQCLRQSLQLLLEAQLPGQWWNYAIFWQSTESLTLTLKDGHLRGLKNTKQRPDSDSITDMADPEWFYMTSFTKTFAAHEGVLGRAFFTGSLVWLTGGPALRLHNCERAREAYGHGLRTLVCIPVPPHGVLELGSSDLNEESWTLVQQALSLFGTTWFAPNSAEEYSEVLPYPSPIPALEQSGLDPGWKKEYKKTGRKPDHTRPNPVDHVEAERQRREKMNMRFYALRSVVPNVSKMDKASLLSDAVAYIKDLRARVRALEAHLDPDGGPSSKRRRTVETGPHDPASSVTTNIYNYDGRFSHGLMNAEVEVRFIGGEAIVRVQSGEANYPTARLMEAVKDLRLRLHHATMSTINGTMLQDIVVRVPDELGDEAQLKTAILERI